VNLLYVHGIRRFSQEGSNDLFRRSNVDYNLSVPATHGFRFKLPVVTQRRGQILITELIDWDLFIAGNL
jgi:hypothetical protein